MKKKNPKHSVVENDTYFFRDQEMFRADMSEEHNTEKVNNKETE